MLQPAFLAARLSPAYPAPTARFTRLMLFWLCCWSSIMAVRAHGPFDSSSQIRVSDAQVEILLTMGADATHEVIASAELPGDIRQVLNPSPPLVPYALPLATVSRLFEVKVNGAALSAESVVVFTDGLESIFRITFPRVDGESLEVRAAYFNGIESIRGGPLVAVNEGGKVLGTALISRVNDSVGLPLPKRTVAPDRPVSESAIAQQERAGGKISETAPDTMNAAAIPRPSFGEFLQLGVEHILRGFDHLLFLCALLFGVRHLKTMWWVITCFTLAHSVTLGLSALELVTVSSRIVEPLIALSIIVVAIENLVRKDAVADRYWLAVGFGLIHGFGFAQVLRDTGLAESGADVMMPLFSFNLGVELGQLAVAAVVLPLLLALRRSPTFSRFGIPAVSALVIATSGYWLLERTLFYR